MSKNNVRYLLISSLILSLISQPFSANAASKSSLVVTYKETPSSAAQKWTLKCNPAGGTMKGSKSVCGKLALLSSPFAKPSNSEMCAQIFESAEVATVSGTWNGKKVFARFSKSDGCEQKRWKDLAFLVQGKKAP